MALVDTQGFVMAVDRSLFGPQGRRWIERKLPDVVTNLAFIGVSAVGALILCFHITREYYQSGYWAILQTPKHVLNAVILHLVARALRWHLDRLLGLNFAARDQALPDFFAASAQEGRGDGRDDGNNGSNNHHKPAVVWPWQSSQSHSRAAQLEPRDRLDSTASTTDQEQSGRWGSGGGNNGINVSRNHRRSLSADRAPPTAEGTRAPAAQEAAAAAAALASAGAESGGSRAGAKNNRRRRRSLTGSSSSSPATPPPTAEASTAAVTGRREAGGGRERGETEEGEEETGVRTAMAAAVVSAAAAAAAGITGGGEGGGEGGSRRWRKPIDKLSRALGSTRRRASLQAGRPGRDAADGGAGNEVQQPRLNFFTEADLDELLHSNFFIKMCDDASWLYVEDHPYVPELNWLLTLWGGYKIAPRFQGEVKQNEAHRMLFQCESGRHRGNIRIRSRATNTFLFFLGVKQPLTWVAWDRDVVGGDWEDLKLEWVGKPRGPDGVLVGDERGRVVIRSRRINGYVSWNGSRFTHVPGREGATVFMLQRMASSSGGGGSAGGSESMAASAQSTHGMGEKNYITISPATSNEGVEFTSDFDRVFRSSTLQAAFEQHPAFKAVFTRQQETPSALYGSRSGANSAEKYPGRIVAVSTESATATAKPGLAHASKGLISAIMTAYSTHCNLVISPDDVWLTILGQQNIKSPELADWFRPGFSTTTERDEVCAAATAMSSLQAYFEYMICMTCGIPSVTLMGTVADWKLLREKIERLLEFEVEGNPEGKVMEIWVGYLRKVCDGFVESAEHPGSPETLEFWDKVLSHISHGSGMNYTTGWVSAFTCFNSAGNFLGKKKANDSDFPMIRDTAISHNVVSCPRETATAQRKPCQKSDSSGRMAGQTTGCLVTPPTVFASKSAAQLGRQITHPSADVFDVILCDPKLAGGDGLQSCRAS
eukprot:g6804.t2